MYNFSFHLILGEYQSLLITDYLDTIYGRASKTKLHELDILYKKVAKIVLGVEKTQSSINVYKDMTAGPLIFLYVQNSEWSMSL